MKNKTVLSLTPLLLLMVTTLFLTPKFGEADTPPVYWTDWDTSKIQRLVGGRAEDLPIRLDQPFGIALDVTAGKVYWTDSGTDKIQRANLDGGNVEDLVTGLRDPEGIALDISGGKIYWTDSGTDKIQRKNLNGGNVEDLVTRADTGLERPHDIALDVGRGKMYWTDTSTGKIQRANLNGRNVEDLVTGLESPEGIALDTAANKMYWTDWSTDEIWWANLDDLNPQPLITTGISDPVDIDLDLNRGKMYWVEQGSDKVRCANLDGSGVEDLVTTGLSRPFGIAVGRGAVINNRGDDHGDAPAEATVLPLGSSIAGRIEPSSDVDYFRVAVNGPGQLTVYTTGNFDTLGSLRTNLGSLLIDNDNGGDNLNFRVQRQVRAGTYYVRVEGHGNAIGNYTVHATFSSDGDDHGNTRALATRLSLGSSIAGRIEPGDDVDYFQFTVVVPGELILYTTGNIDTVGWLEAGGRNLADDDDSGDGLNFRIQHRTGTGTHHIKVESHGGQTGNYTLHTRFTSDGGGGADDHGNTRADATIIQNVGDSVAGRIEPGDDVDYFRVRVNALGQLTVYTTGNIDTSGQLQNNSGALLTKDDDNGDNLNFRMQHKVNAGTYYVEVTSWAEVGNYTLHTGFTPDRGGGTDDHGNTRADTTLIQNVGDSVAGRIEPGDDIDYFRVRVHDPGQLTVYTTGNIDTIGWLEDISGDTLSDDDDDGDNLNFRIQHKVSAGWYRIKVKSHGDQTGNYTLRTSFTPDDLRLTIPEDLISEVAFGPNSTYFVLNAQYPILTGASGDLSYGGCILTLDLPGVPDNTLLATVWLTVLERFIQAIDEIDRAVPLFQFLDQLGVSPFDLVADVGAGVFLPNARKYFIFPLETMQEVRDKIQEEAIRSQNITLIAAAIGSLPLAGDVGAVIVSLGVIELQRLSALIELVQSTMDPKIHLNPGVGELVNAIIGGRSILDVFIDFFDRDNRPNDRLRYLIYIPKRVEEIDIKVEQKYNLKGQTGELTYEGTWNLVSGTLAAPNAHSMSLADYPPFQELPLEVQEFLLRYFGEPMGIGDWQIPEVTSLLPNYPNPFNPETWIPYQLSEAADVTMTLYDITGRVVRHLDLGHQRAGVYHNRSRAAYWDGRNAQGEPVASGVYFYTLKAGEFAATRKMLIRK